MYESLLRTLVKKKKNDNFAHRIMYTTDEFVFFILIFCIFFGFFVFPFFSNSLRVFYVVHGHADDGYTEKTRPPLFRPRLAEYYIMFCPAL